MIASALEEQLAACWRRLSWRPTLKALDDAARWRLGVGDWAIGWCGPIHSGSPAGGRDAEEMTFNNWHLRCSAHTLHPDDLPSSHENRRERRAAQHPRR